MPTEYFLPTFLTATDYYPGMCGVEWNEDKKKFIVKSEPREELEQAMNALLGMSNIQPNTEARIVEDLWGNFETSDSNYEEECKQLYSYYVRDSNDEG